jgi:hypothetical protein
MRALIETLLAIADLAGAILAAIARGLTGEGD